MPHAADRAVAAGVGAGRGAVAATYYHPSDSPTLMFNGTADLNVPIQVATQTATDLYNAKVPIIFETLQGAGHVPFDTNGPLMISQSVYFCYDLLDLAHAAGQARRSRRRDLTRVPSRRSVAVQFGLERVPPLEE